jgi:hypothetical protein
VTSVTGTECDDTECLSGQFARIGRVSISAAWNGGDMSEEVTLHPYDPGFVAQFVAAVRGQLLAAEFLPHLPAWAIEEIERDRQGYALAKTGSEAGANVLSAGLARTLATVEPVFYTPGAGLTQLEARYDRSIGMLLRPPSRLFGDAGLETSVARAMPIRLDASGAIMGGAYIPPSLIDQFADLLDRHAEKLALRMTESLLDAPSLLAVLLEAASYAATQRKGLFEAADIIVPGVPASYPPGLRLIMPDRRRLAPELRKRLQEAAHPPKKPGLLARLFGRGGAAADRVSRNGRVPAVSDVTPPPERESRDQEG